MINIIEAVFKKITKLDESKNIMIKRCYPPTGVEANAINYKHIKTMK